MVDIEEDLSKTEEGLTEEASPLNKSHDSDTLVTWNNQNAGIPFRSLIRVLLKTWEKGYSVVAKVIQINYM